MHAKGAHHIPCVVALLLLCCCPGTRPQAHAVSKPQLVATHLFNLLLLLLLKVGCGSQDKRRGHEARQQVDCLRLHAAGFACALLA